MAAEKVTKAASTAPNADKKRAIETAMAKIEKLYGKGYIMRSHGFGDIQIVKDLNNIPRVVYGTRVETI